MSNTTQLCLHFQPTVFSIENQVNPWLVFAFFIYFLGICGAALNRRNLFYTILCFEIMYLGAITSFVVLGGLLFDFRGYIYGLVLLIFAACESAVGLGILVATVRLGTSIDWSTLEIVGG